MSPCQNGILPGSPGAGETTTRSIVMSSIRHDARAEHEHLAPPALVDHLLVELADAAAVAVNTPNSPRSGIVPPLAIAIRPAPSRARRVSVRRSQTMRGRSSGEVVARVAAREQVEDVCAAASSDRSAKFAARRTTRSEVGHRPLVHRAHRDDLLREHVERVPRVARLLDRALEHPADDDGGLEQVAAVLGEHLAAARLADLVARAADPLQPTATEPGDSTWITRSTAPMSIPSSSELVATMQRSVPRLSASSISSRCSRAIEP